ncbi:Protein MAIN-LIKE 1 [Glycine soja]
MQRATAAVVGDARHVDDAAEEVFQHAKEAGVDAQDFPGGPHDTLVMAAYADHVVVIVLNGEGLISTFVERWHKETSNFHLLVGEVTITLDDVTSLLHLSIISAFHDFDTFHVDEASLEIKLELRQYSVMGHTYAYHGYERFIIANVRSDIGLKSATHMHVVFLDAFRDLSQSRSYAWGDVALVLGSCRPSAYHTTCLIYHTIIGSVGFMSIFHLLLRLLRTQTMMKGHHVPATEHLRRHYQHRYIRSLESLTSFHVFLDISDGVSLLSYTNQRGWCDNLGMLSFEDIDDKWMHFSKYLAPVGQICVVHGQCAPNYIRWFYMISHPFMTPRIHPDMHEFPVATITMEEAPAPAPSDVEQPRHAVVCQAIAERLERLLNIRIVTEGTEAHGVM